MANYKKPSKRMTIFDYHDGYYYKLPKFMVQQMVEESLNKFGFDVATMASHQQALNLAKDYEDYLIEKEKTPYEETVATAEELSTALIESRQLINDPLGYALNRAKKKIGRDYRETSVFQSSFGGIINKNITMRYAGQQVLETTINTVENVADSAINRYTTLQEDYLTAQTYSNVKSTISRAKQLGGSIVSGAVSGMATAGPAGAVIGAVSSAISFGANQYLEYQKRMSSYYQQLNATNFQTNYSASRLGLVNNGRGTEN